MHAWLNGTLLQDPHGPAVTVSDHGMTVGDGVFEAVKVVDGQPFALSRHLRRLARSAGGLGLPAPDETGVPRRGGPSAGVPAASPPGGPCRSGGSGSPTPVASRRSARDAVTTRRPWSSS